MTLQSRLAGVSMVAQTCLALSLLCAAWNGLLPRLSLREWLTCPNKASSRLALS